MTTTLCVLASYANSRASFRGRSVSDLVTGLTRLDAMFFTAEPCGGEHVGQKSQEPSQYESGLQEN